MVKVSKYQLSIPNPDGTWEVRDIEVVFSSRTKLFTIEVPVHIQESMGAGKHLSADTLKAVETSFSALIYKYDEFLKNRDKRKVIAVEFTANLKLMSPDETGDDYLELSDISFAGQPTLHLSYLIGYEVNDDLYDLSLGHNLTRSHDGPRNATILDWTEEREQFFKNAVENLESMIFKVHRFMKTVGSKPELLDAFIARQPMLLPEQTERRE